MKNTFTLIFLSLFLFACEKTDNTPDPITLLKSTVWTEGAFADYSAINERRFYFKNDSLFIEEYHYNNASNYLNKVNCTLYSKVRYKINLLQPDSIIYSVNNYTYNYRLAINSDSITLYKTNKVEWVYYSKEKVRKYKFYWEPWYVLL